MIINMPPSIDELDRSENGEIEMDSFPPPISKLCCKSELSSSCILVYLVNKRWTWPTIVNDLTLKRIDEWNPSNEALPDHPIVQESSFSYRNRTTLSSFHESSTKFLKFAYGTDAEEEISKISTEKAKENSPDMTDFGSFSSGSSGEIGTTASRRQSGVYNEIEEFIYNSAGYLISESKV